MTVPFTRRDARLAALDRARTILNLLAGLEKSDLYAELCTLVVETLDRSCARRLNAGREELSGSVADVVEPVRDFFQRHAADFETPAAELAEPLLADALLQELLLRLHAEGDIVLLGDRQRARSRAFEIVHYLGHLRQRTHAGEREGVQPRLVEMIKVDAVPRQRPLRDQSSADMVAYAAAVLDREPRPDLDSLLPVDIAEPLGQAFLAMLDACFGSEATFAPFQARSLETLLTAALTTDRAAEAFVIAAGTGFGKTEAFLFPILYCAAYNAWRKARTEREGVAAILLYPRTDLCDNQTERLLGYLYHLNAALRECWDEHEFGRFRPLRVALAHSGVGRSFRVRCPACAAERAIARQRKDNSWTADDDRAAFICAVINPDSPYKEVESFRCERAPDRHAATAALLVYQVREGSEPADIVVTTIDTLHRRLMDKHGRAKLFNRRWFPPRFVVVDEMHIYEGQSGAHAAHVLRRCRQRIRALSDEHGEPVLVGASATAGFPQQAGARMFGFAEKQVELLSPSAAEEKPLGLEYYFFVQSPGTRSVELPGEKNAADEEGLPPPEDDEDGLSERSRLVVEQSTIIQAAFCLQHAIKAPAGEQPAKRRVLGFVDSVDGVERLAWNLYQAEWQDLRGSRRPPRTVPLYAMRYPAGRPAVELEQEVRAALRLFYRVPDEDLTALRIEYSNPDPADGCPRAITRDCLQPPHPLLERCPRYESGQCWFTSGQPGGEGLRPIAVQTHRSGRRGWGDGKSVRDEDRDLWRLLVATSALEVGFDNEELIATWQYHAPPSVASFVQRKGRGGRGVRDYPITMLVLGASPRDVYCFQDHQRLVQVEQRDVATYVDPENPSVRTQHIFAALFDFCASDARLHRAYHNDFDLALEALRNRRAELTGWLRSCFPSETPGQLDERLRALIALIANVYAAEIDFSALSGTRRPSRPITPRQLLDEPIERIRDWERATRGVAGAERTNAWLARRVARDDHSRQASASVADFAPFVPDGLLQDPDLCVPRSTIPEPLGRRVLIRSLDGQTLGEEPAEFALGCFLPGGFKIRYNGVLWMAPWERALGAPPTPGPHVTWAATRSYLNSGGGLLHEEEAASVLESSDLNGARRQECLQALGAGCLVLPVREVQLQSLGQVRQRKFLLSLNPPRILLRKDDAAEGDELITLARDPHISPRFALIPRRRIGREITPAPAVPLGRAIFHERFDVTIAHYANLVHCYPLKSRDARTLVVRFWDEQRQRPLAPAIRSRSQAVEFRLDLRLVPPTGWRDSVAAVRAFWRRVADRLVEELVVSAGILENAYLAPELVEVLRAIEPTYGTYLRHPPDADALLDAARKARHEQRVRGTAQRAAWFVESHATAIEDLLARAADWVWSRGEVTIFTDTFAAAIARAAGRRLNVSPWNFRRFVEVGDDQASIYLFDDLEGGSGNSRRLSQELPRWAELLTDVVRELDCPVAAADAAVARVLGLPTSPTTLALLAAEEEWPADWLPPDSGPRLRPRLRRLLDTPELAAFNLYAFGEYRDLESKYGGPPTLLRLLDHVRRTPALDLRAEHLRLRFLEGDDEEASELASRLRASIPLCESSCPVCLALDRFDRQPSIDRPYLLAALADHRPR
ncbi:MAG: DEAD/DEAH box helicase [Pirellulaceae bacterium]|nr:DEAD/DEAH box helicase [Pirellulaceae bacterium]